MLAGFYSKKNSAEGSETKRNLWRHSQKCPARIQYF